VATAALVVPEPAAVRVVKGVLATVQGRASVVTAVQAGRLY
jgi:hypothetical protein